MVDNEIEQCRHVVLGTAGLSGRPPFFGRAEKSWEIELFVVGAERGKEVKGFVLNLEGALLGFVDLVDDNDRSQTQRQRLAEDEFGLRHRAFGGINQHQRAVDHTHDALDLAAEIGMAGGVDDIDTYITPHHGGTFGQDRDAALALDRVRIKRLGLNVLVVTKRATLP